jgi:hypothetical protein
MISDPFEFQYFRLETFEIMNEIDITLIVWREGAMKLELQNERVP